jgi:hypothetical protein
MCVETDPEVLNMYYARIAKGVGGIQEEVDAFPAVSSQKDPAKAKIEVENIKEVKALLHYIRFEQTSEKEYSNGIRDHGRPPTTLNDFMADPKARLANLSEAELVALRLYTTIAFLFMNWPLRDDERYASGRPCPLAVTTHFALCGIKKLRAVHLKSGEMTLWRGMRNLNITEEFLKEGGTEMAFMSTTTDMSVAVNYCLSHHSLIFKIVSPDFMSMGAEVQWLSAFPGEAEILYPPLTYLKPSGRTQVVKIEYNCGPFWLKCFRLHL